MARMPFEKILIVGEMTNLFVNQASREGYAKEKMVDLGRANPSAIIDSLTRISKEKNQSMTVFGCGNMIGIENFIDAFEKLSQDTQQIGSRP